MLQLHQTERTNLTTSTNRIKPNSAIRKIVMNEHDEGTWAEWLFNRGFELGELFAAFFKGFEAGTEE